MWTRRLFRAISKDDIYNLDVLKVLETIGNEYSDGLALDHFSLTELKKRVSPEIVERLIGKDSVLNHPEFANFSTFADVTAHNHPLIPPHLTRPAILLNERQAMAKRMTLDFINTEDTLKATRLKEFEDSPMVSSDGYFVHLALVVARDPIWLLSNSKKVEYNMQLLKIKKAHNILPKADQNLIGEVAEVKAKDTEGMILKEAETLFKRGEDITHLQERGSTHFLRANPIQADPHEIDYAGGYRTYLLLKDRQTEEWQLPEVPLYGSKTFGHYTDEILKSILGGKLELYHFNTKPCDIQIIDFPAPISIPRPRAFAEDVYDLFLRRAKILFPEAEEPDLKLLLAKRNSMEEEKASKKQKIKGKKVFNFRSLHLSGNYVPSNENYIDWAWVPKLQLNKYLTKERYARLIGSLL